jgi:hypothetical protein
MILVYISFERFISIKYPDKKFILNKNIYQYVYMIILVVFNLSINSWVPFDYGLVDKRNTTNKFITNYNTNENFECVSKSFKGPLLWTVYGKIIINQIGKTSGAYNSGSDPVIINLNYTP